jgi:hypothetical protein
MIVYRSDIRSHYYMRENWVGGKCSYTDNEVKITPSKQVALKNPQRGISDIFLLNSCHGHARLRMGYGFVLNRHGDDLFVVIQMYLE